MTALQESSGTIHHEEVIPGKLENGDLEIAFDKFSRD